MTQDEKQSIIDLQGTPGFKVLEHLLKLKIDELKDVTNIDLTSQVEIGIQALANKKAVALLKDILSDIGFNQTVKEQIKTYE